MDVHKSIDLKVDQQDGKLISDSFLNSLVFAFATSLYHYKVDSQELIT